MLRAITIIAAIVLILHGLVHLLYPPVYLKVTSVRAFDFKTTLLGGRWNVGENGIRVFGFVWLVPVLGFVLAGIAWLAGWSWWQPVLLTSTAVSLMLTALDWSVAYGGVVIDIAILVILGLGSRLLGFFSP